MYFFLHPADECFARLFAGQPPPSAQWLYIGLCVKPNGTAFIDSIDYGIGGFVPPHPRTRDYDAETITLRSALAEYDLSRAPHVEVLLSVSVRHNHPLAGDVVFFSEELASLYKSGDDESDPTRLRRDLVAAVASSGRGWRMTGVTGVVATLHRRYMHFVCAGPTRFLDVDALRSNVDACVNKKRGEAQPHRLKHRCTARVASADATTTVTRSARECRTLFRPMLPKALRELPTWYACRPEYEHELAFAEYRECVMALLPLRLTPYLVLWILDYDRERAHIARLVKITLIEKLFCRYRGMREQCAQRVATAKTH